MHVKSILLVEDDPDHVALALRALKKSNIPAEVAVATSGPEALERLVNAVSDGTDGLPEVILLDLKLPNMNGFEVLRRLRADERTAHVPVVILTSSDEERDKDECYNLGANSYILKPVDYDRFLETIREAGNYWLRLNRVAYGG